MTLHTWSQTAANNATADATINWAEGQTPGSVNNSARALMAAMAKFRDDNNFSLVTAGGTTAYTLTTNQVFTAYADGMFVTFEVNDTNTGNVTLNVDGLGAKSVRAGDGAQLEAGEFIAGQKVAACYDSSAGYFILVNLFPFETFAATTAMLFAQTSAPTGWTKDTNYNNNALRVVSGTASSGGSVDFTTAFASQDVDGTVGGTTLTESQIPAHDHALARQETQSSNDLSAGERMAYRGGITSSNTDFRYHLCAATTGDDVGVTGEAGGGTSHDHSFSGTAINLAVKYLDVIMATKDA